MIPAIKAEFLKLFTVRSTYIILALSVVIIFIFAGITEGFKLDPLRLKDPGLMASDVSNAITSLSIFAGIIAILLFSHEYRYNTIMHTLTNTNSRSKVLLAKIIIITGFAAGFALLSGVLSPLFSYLGIQLAGNGDLLVTQNIPFVDLIWKSIFTFWAYGMFGLLFVALTRNQVFSIVALFFLPVAETISGALLKSNAIYQPFTAITAIMQKNQDLAPGKAVVIATVYLICLWIVAWLLFLRRDASSSRS